MNTATGLARAVGIAFAMIGAAEAVPLALPSGPLYFQFNNIEQFSASNSIMQPGSAVNPVTLAATAATTEGNWGVFNLSAIQAGAASIPPHVDIGGGPVFWSDDGPGAVRGQITGIFWGVTVTSGTTATGGFIDLWWHDAGSDTVTAADLIGGAAFTPSDRTGANTEGTGKFVGGTFLARLEFAPGVIDNDTTTTISSTVTPTSTVVNGTASSYANVVDMNGDSIIDGSDGAWAVSLDTDWFWVNQDGDLVPGEGPSETRDLRFANRFDGLCSSLGCNPYWGVVPGTDIFGLRSNDPGRVFVPEPGSLALLGVALLGAAVGIRRRKDQTT